MAAAVGAELTMFMPRLMPSAIVRGVQPFLSGRFHTPCGRPSPRGSAQPTGVRQNFDVSPDGKRVVMFPRPIEQAEGSLHATFLLNFFDEVRRRIP